MNTNSTNTETLSEKEGNDLFYKAFSELSGQEHKPSEFVDVVEPKEKPAPEEPAAPTSEEVVPPEKGETAAQPEKVEEPSTEQPKQPESIEQLLGQFDEDKRKLVENILAERAKVEQQFRSAQGRFIAERRQRQQLEFENTKLKRLGGNTDTQDPSLAKQKQVDYENAISEWKQVVEAEPTLAKAVDALTDAKVKQVEESLRSELTTRDELQERQIFEDTKQREIELLLNAVPNALDVVRTQEFQWWKDNVAPPGVRSLAENSINHLDAISVLQQYAPWAQGLADQRAVQQPAPQAPVPASNVADQISNARQEKISPVVKGAPVRPVVPAALGNEFSAEEGQRLFEEAYNKLKNR